MDATTPDEIERHLAALQVSLTTPRAGECVFCFVDRMLDAFGCATTLRWARRWRDLRLPRATGLERRLGARGGHCDCEVFLNGWDLRPDLQVPDEQGEPGWPRPRPECAGVGPRSSQPCAHWVARRRDRRPGWW
ncbi:MULTISPECIES: DUF2695 domain-containing protein [unclassified Blastococcus]